MKYVSTRGQAPILGFKDVLLAGLARDGGLYVPETWPTLSKETIASFAGKPYHEVAFEVIKPFIDGEWDDETLYALVKEAYSDFGHEAIAPLVQKDARHWIMELFHGPTLAFKDVAMQLLGGMMDLALQERGERATIVGATSGDTGGAAIEAFRGRDAIDIFILHPHNRVSEVQRRQMTTPEDSNVFNIALDGTFDDCQAIVKGLFNDLEFRDNMKLAGVNSINWARILAQVVYYFTTSVALGGPSRKFSFSVPSGNFGDIFAGFVAHKMGLPVERLIIATNVNDILARTLKTGSYAAKDVVATDSPSMDIQVSSNFERLLFELSGRNPQRVIELMNDFSQQGSFTLAAEELETLRSKFDAFKVSEEEVQSVIKNVFERNDYIADPHTAVGLGATEKFIKNAGPGNDVNIVTLSTAHPAKFPDAVERACGQKPPVPQSVAQQAQKTERYDVVPNDQSAVADFIRAHSAVSGSANA